MLVLTSTEAALLVLACVRLGFGLGLIVWWWIDP